MTLVQPSEQQAWQRPGGLSRWPSKKASFFQGLDFVVYYGILQYIVNIEYSGRILSDPIKHGCGAVMKTDKPGNLGSPVQGWHIMEIPACIFAERLGHNFDGMNLVVFLPYAQDEESAGHPGLRI